MDTVLTPAYVSPEIVGMSGELAGEEEPYLIFLVAATVTMAAVWVAYCKLKGGHPSVSFNWWNVKVSCTR